ncbi:hypothetical protein Tco_1106372 [Tanacetum coccineum]
MNHEQIQQAARDKALVPTANKVKISSTYMTIDPTMPQKEETYQFILDIIKNSDCYNAFLVTADVPEIYMQVDVEQFRKIPGISRRVPNEDFNVPPSEESMITLLYELGLKFVRTGEDFQEYGRDIPDMMLTDEIKQLEAYQAFIGYSTGLIPPKKSRGKGSQGKKAAATLKKKSSISTDDNIILEPDVGFVLGKSISRTEAKIVEQARRIHENHERLVTEKPASKEDSDESEGEPANRPTGRRRPSGIVFKDTSQVSKKKSLDQYQKVKGIQVLTEEEQLAADMIQAIKASKINTRSQLHTGDSSKGAGITLEVPDESTDKLTTSSEGAGITLEVPDEVKGSSARMNDDYEMKMIKKALILRTVDDERTHLTMSNAEYAAMN